MWVVSLPRIQRRVHHFQMDCSISLLFVCLFSNRLDSTVPLSCFLWHRTRPSFNTLFIMALLPVLGESHGQLSFYFKIILLRYDKGMLKKYWNGARGSQIRRSNKVIDKANVKQKWLLPGTNASFTHSVRWLLLGLNFWSESCPSAT